MRSCLFIAPTNDDAMSNEPLGCVHTQATGFGIWRAGPQSKVSHGLPSELRAGVTDKHHVVHRPATQKFAYAGARLLRATLLRLRQLRSTPLSETLRAS